jgi:hypothetical protein
MIDITMTACRRAAILERTLASFKRHLFKDADAQLIMNVDPVGPDRLVTVLKVAWREFPGSVLTRAAAQPSFPKAFKWAWSTTSAPWVFHLEDDWELLCPVSLGHMIQIMEEHPDLAVLRLPWRPTGFQAMKNWRYFFPWNGQFFECPSTLRWEVGFCGHPSLIRGDFVRKAAQLLNDEQNPEKQFHYWNKPLIEEVVRWRFGVFAKQNQDAAVQDIGREWMQENDWQKAGTKAFFTHWERAQACG